MNFFFQKCLKILNFYFIHILEVVLIRLLYFQHSFSLFLILLFNIFGETKLCTMFMKF